MTFMEVLKVLPRDAVDLNTQRCWMGPALMSGLGLRLGAPVLIRVQRGACLCTVWPRHDLAEGFLQISPQCVTPDLSAQTLAGLTVKPAHITPLTCPKLSSVSVKVFVQRLEHKRKVSELSVHELLEGLYVHRGHLVDLSGAETEIRCVLVETVNSGSQKAGLVTARTHVEVSLTQTVKHLERRKEVSVSSLGGPRGGLRLAERNDHVSSALPRDSASAGSVVPERTASDRAARRGEDPMLVRCMARDIGATLVTVNGPESHRFSTRRERGEPAARVWSGAGGGGGGSVRSADRWDRFSVPEADGGESSGAPENRLVAQLLTLMDGIGNHEGFVIIGATNQPDALDPALRRPGRFDREVILGKNSHLGIFGPICNIWFISRGFRFCIWIFYVFWI